MTPTPRPTVTLTADPWKSGTGVGFSSTEILTLLALRDGESPKAPDEPVAKAPMCGTMPREAGRDGRVTRPDGVEIGRASKIGTVSANWIGRRPGWLLRALSDDWLAPAAGMLAAPPAWAVALFCSPVAPPVAGNVAPAPIMSDASDAVTEAAAEVAVPSGSDEEATIGTVTAPDWFSEGAIDGDPLTIAVAVLLAPIG